MVDRRRAEPLYLQIENHIRSEIEQGKIKIGDKLMSETEMQRFYGVARPTIRAALSRLVSEGCLRKEHGLGTFCVARPQREQRINVDVVTNQSDSYFYPYILKGVSEVFERNNCNLLLHDSSGSLGRTVEILRRTLERGTDGIIVPAGHIGDREWEEFCAVLEQYRQAKIPTVVMMGPSPLPGGVGFAIDQVYGAQLSAQYLLDCGHRRLLGLFCYPNSEFSCRERLKGFQNAISLVPDAKSWHLIGQETYEPEVLRMIREEGITAIQCFNDQVAVQCLRLLVENGYRVPDDISLVGFDDTELSRTSIPALTTIVHPKDHLGSEAAEAIIHMVRYPGEPQEGVVYRPGLVIRQSVRKLE